MIGWLRGSIKHRFQRGSRSFALIVTGGIGYEVQLIQRDWSALITENDYERWVHQVVSAESLQLFGFASIAERDLFRDIIGVSGVGPQAALALLDALELEELLRALVQSDIKSLCRAQGVGKRTAERMALELRSKLEDRVDFGNGQPSEVHPASQELLSTLETLGYETEEIHSALKRLNDRGGPPSGDDDAWLRACIQLMSE